MNKFISYLLILLDKADVFRFPLTLTLKRTEKTSTSTGKIITFGILTFLLYSFIVSDIVKKKNSQTLIQDLIQITRPKIYFSKQNFTMAFGVANSDNVFYTDETIYSFIFYNYHLNNKEKFLNQTSNIMKLCTQDDFIEDPSEFSRLNLNGTYCLPNEILKLGGFWDEEIIDSFWIELRTCQNSSSSNVICKSPEEIGAYLKNNYVDIYISNHNIDSSNYEKPLTRNLKIFYQLLDLNLFKSVDLYMKHCHIKTDDGFLIESLNVIDSFIQEKIETDISLLDNEENLIYSFNLYSSNYQANVQRNYQKIQSLLAELGGICNFFFLFGFMICKLEKHYKLVSLLSNELFIFPTLQKTSFGSNIKKQNVISCKSHEVMPLQIPTNTSEKECQKEFSKDHNKNFQSEYESNHLPSFPPKEIHSLLKLNKVSFDQKINESNQQLKPKILVDAEISVDFHESQVIQTSNASKQPLDIHSPGSEINFHTERSSSPFGKKSWKTKLKSMTNLRSSIKSKSMNSPEMQMMGNLDNYQILKKKENFFSLGFVGFLIILLKKKMFCFFNKITIREKLFKIAEDQIADELDIIKILKKLQDIEKLKRILLNEDQLYLFNLLSKPMIILENSSKQENDQDKNAQDKRFKFTLKNNLNLEKKKLLNIYKCVKEKENDSQIDKKLIKLLDEDVMCFMINDKLIE